MNTALGAFGAILAVLTLACAGADAGKEAGSPDWAAYQPDFGTPGGNDAEAWSANQPDFGKPGRGDAEVVFRSIPVQLFYQRVNHW